MGLDRSNKKVILGTKQLEDNPWPQILEKFPIGKVVKGEVIKITNFGVFVEIDDTLEGLVFSGEIEKDAMDKLKPGEKMKVKIIKIDQGSAKIGLSAKIDEEQDSPTS